jgi:activator of HSP90 ATPase
MPATIRQKITLRISPERLFSLFLDGKEHAAFTGAPARISKKAGASFRVMDFATGRNLQLVPGKQIVQSWRADDWGSSDPDSLLILNFAKAPGGATLEMIHAGVPEREAKNLDEGWRDYYWKPLKSYLANR